MLSNCLIVLVIKYFNDKCTFQCIIFLSLIIKDKIPLKYNFYYLNKISYILSTKKKKKKMRGTERLQDSNSYASDLLKHQHKNKSHSKE